MFMGRDIAFAETSCDPEIDETRSRVAAGSIRPCKRDAIAVARAKITPKVLAGDEPV